QLLPSRHCYSCGPVGTTPPAQRGSFGMTLLSPWWLLLIPLLYGVILLHTMHPQRHRVLVPSTLLWERVLRELEADARWHRLVANLLLLVQLAALLALILALTRPAFLYALIKQRHDIYI